MSNRPRRVLVAAAVAIVVVVAAVLAILAGRRGPETVVVERGSLEATIQTVGHLAARNTISVRPAVSGQVSLVAVTPGERVVAGDVIAELDQQPFRDAITHADQQVTIAESALNSAEQQGGSEPSPAQLAARLTANENLRAARQALDTASASLVSTLILAPADGTVLSVSTAAGVPLAQGTDVAEIANLLDLQLQVDVDEIDLPHVSTGMAVSFTVDAYPGQTIDGTLTQISPAAVTSGGTTTFLAVVAFKPPSGLVLRPGMSANVSIKTAVRNGVLLIPESALRTVGQRTFVTVVTDGNTQQREIMVGLRSGGMVEVASGLSAGERIAAHP